MPKDPINSIFLLPAPKYAILSISQKLGSDEEKYTDISIKYCTILLTGISSTVSAYCIKLVTIMFTPTMLLRKPRTK
jgi:hypothetical protein